LTCARASSPTTGSGADPQPATPDAVAAVVREVLDHFDWQGEFGCTFPAAVQHGMVRTAANVDQSWIGTDADKLLASATGRQPLVVNDADAAGVAEVRFGAAKDQDGVVLVSTLGTGIGSALLVDGQLVPNTELGHVELDGTTPSRGPPSRLGSARTCPGRTGPPG